MSPDNFLQSNAANIYATDSASAQKALDAVTKASAGIMTLTASFAQGQYLGMWQYANDVDVAVKSALKAIGTG